MKVRWQRQYPGVGPVARVQRLPVGRLATLCALALMIVCAGRDGSAHAQPVPAGDPAAGSFITPFPENETYRLQVWGDSFAEGLAAGLADQLASEPRIQMTRRHRALPGVLRSDAAEEAKRAEAEIAVAPPHIIVISFGLSDRVALRLENGRRAAIASPEWKEHFGRQLDILMRAFRHKPIGVYWVGLPVMRRNDVTEDVQAINEVVRARALVNGIRYIDIFTNFAGEDRSFSAYGPDLAGKNRLLREQDGVHFTWAGWRKLAHFVERELKRDLAQARQERNVTLLGTEDEQKRIRPQSVRLAPPSSGRTGTARRGEQGGAPARTADGPGDGSASREVKADNSRVSIKTTGAGGRQETVTIEIARPPIPVAVLTATLQREISGSASQLGAPVMSDIGNGITVTSTITPTAENAAAVGERQRRSPTSAPYFRVLIKGEQLPPKPGRADELPWPRPEAVAPEPSPPQRAQAAPPAAPVTAPAATPAGTDRRRGG